MAMPAVQTMQMITTASPRSGGDLPTSPATTPGARAVAAFELIEARDDDARRELEAFIRHRYALAYGATVRHFLPRLFALRDRRGQLIAAFGLRSAASERLFLETYLDEPVEAQLSAATGVSARRDAIMEVGNLAGRHPGALRILIGTLAQALPSFGARWVVFTGGPQLINGFERLGVPLLTLAPARLERLPVDERADWGRYYDYAPTVMCANVRITQRRLAQVAAVAGA